MNHIVNNLEAPGIASQKSKGHLELVDSLRLLEFLSLERPLSKLVRSEIRTEESDPLKVERMVRNFSVHKAGRYALTAFSALSKYIEYYITYPNVHVYSANASEVIDRVPKGRGDVTLHVLGVDSEIVFAETRQKEDFTVVEPIQVVIDLFGLGGAGRDGAMKLYDQVVQGKLEKNTAGRRVVQRTA